MVCFSIMLKSSYMIMAIAPTTTKPANAKPICIAEPAEMSKYPIPSFAAVISDTVVPKKAYVIATLCEP